MAFIGAALFAVIFLFLSSGFRSNLGHSLNSAADWIQAWSPYSYGVVIIILMIPAIAFCLVAFGPKKDAPVGANARYKPNEIVGD